jgi:hypothetical protein
MFRCRGQFYLSGTEARWSESMCILGQRWCMLRLSQRGENQRDCECDTMFICYNIIYHLIYIATFTLGVNSINVDSADVEPHSSLAHSIWRLIPPLLRPCGVSLRVKSVGPRGIFSGYEAMLNDTESTSRLTPCWLNIRANTRIKSKPLKSRLLSFFNKIDWYKTLGLIINACVPGLGNYLPPF